MNTQLSIQRNFDAVEHAFNILKIQMDELKSKIITNAANCDGSTTIAANGNRQLSLSERAEDIEITSKRAHKAHKVEGQSHVKRKASIVLKLKPMKTMRIEKKKDKSKMATTSPSKSRVSCEECDKDYCNSYALWRHKNKTHV